MSKKEFKTLQEIDDEIARLSELRATIDEDVERGDIFHHPSLGYCMACMVDSSKLLMISLDDGNRMNGHGATLAPSKFSVKKSSLGMDENYKRVSNAKVKVLLEGTHGNK